MKESRKEFYNAVLVLADTFEKKAKYTTMYYTKDRIETVRTLVVDLFINEFNHLSSTGEVYKSYKMVLKYLKELKKYKDVTFCDKWKKVHVRTGDFERYCRVVYIGLRNYQLVVELILITYHQKNVFHVYIAPF